MSRITKKLDRSSKVLFLIAVLGIIASVYSLYRATSQSEDSREAKDKIATVTVYNNDTRLKRSGSIHWFPVNQPLDCYSSDLVFTGKDSYATIQFNDGGKIKLHPMSLISLSVGHVSLSSGTIEVDLKKNALSVESFGETFKFEENSKLRLENTEGTKRIVPLEGSAKALAQDTKLKEFIRAQTISLVSPTSGQQVPKFDGKSVVFSWKSSQPIKNDFYRVEFSQSKAFTGLLHTAETTTTTKVPSVKLPAGMIHWRVRTLKGKVTAESAFYHSDKFRIERLHPTNLGNYPMREVARKGLLFEWTNPLKGPQRIQVSRNREFTEILQQGEATGTQKVINFDYEGTYHWRVGYVLENESIHWSEAGSFTVDPDVVVAPLEIVDLPEEMDFASKDSYVVKVRDLNNCDQFEYTLSVGEKVVFKTVTASPELKINRLKNGNYRLTVIGKLKQKNLTEPTTLPFRVETSPPLQAPKIKNKKNVKLFVRLLRKLHDLFLPSAAAAEEQFYRLEWEGLEGATYEIEISNKNKKIIHKEEVAEPSYKFYVPGLDLYLWRVRMKKKAKWSPWSEYSAVETEDKIKTVTPPLMVSPEDGESIDVPEKEPSIIFKWTEPDPRYTYYLELSNKAGGTPLKVISVKGGEYDLQLAKLPKEIYWRVYAKSKYENTSISSVRYLLKISVIKEIVIPPSRFILRTAAFQSQTTFTLDKKIADLIDVKDTVPLAGQLAEVNLEYLPGRFFHRKSLNFYLRKSLLAEGDSKLDENKLGLEIGILGDSTLPSTHNFYFGYFYNLYAVEFGPDLGAEFALGFLSGRYVFRKSITGWFSYELGAGTQFTLNFLPSLILRPGVNFKLTQNFGVDLFGLYERYTAKPEFKGDGVSETGTFQIQNAAAGAGITYHF